MEENYQTLLRMKENQLIKAFEKKSDVMYDCQG